MTKTQIARRAHPMVAMTRMLEVANALRVPLGPAASDGAAAVGGAVVHQQQLPSGMALRDDAADGLVEKSLAVQEDGDDGHQRGRSHDRSIRVGVTSSPGRKHGSDG